MKLNKIELVIGGSVQSSTYYVVDVKRRKTMNYDVVIYNENRKE